ncbi:hypothetical protein ANANG_G00314910 [Anguilla anguilla]|uniref:Uncharacterized protein n=1 Tax=Anguilla anguilla TaxID=7936 RepID=A0A9D3RI25_ANGAN|nr:hypothetical protein ANANG_G00314910 [Anguilla anguilla]
MRIWLQKLLSQNPFVLMKPPDALRDNLGFLQDRGFRPAELLQLISKLKGFFSELSAGSMGRPWPTRGDVLRCSDGELREAVLRCPALLYYPCPCWRTGFRAFWALGSACARYRPRPLCWS